MPGWLCIRTPPTKEHSPQPGRQHLAPTCFTSSKAACPGTRPGHPRGGGDCRWLAIWTRRRLSRRAPSPLLLPVHAVHPLPLCSEVPVVVGGGGAPGGPVPSQISHLGLLECVGSASGPMIQHGTDHAGVRRSVIRVTRTRQLGSEDRAGAGSIPPPSTCTVLPATSQPGRRGQAADCSSFRSSSQTRGH